MEYLKSVFLAVCLLPAFALYSCGQTTAEPGKVAKTKSSIQDIKKMEQGWEEITLGAGCFWCVEAVFQELKGVKSVVSGYAGGVKDKPTYKEVCSGMTGHAEVARIVYDPNEVTVDEILEVFWQTHDPTTLNRQGNDVGTQYRSVVFYHTEEQKNIAEKYKKELDASGAFSAPIVTEIVEINNYYEAEEYHQNYYNEHGNESYCRYVIGPKMEKFRKVFKDKLK